MSEFRSKANARHALEKFMPDSFVKEDSGFKPKLIIEDALITLMALKQGILNPADPQTRTTSCSDIIVKMKNSAEYALRGFYSTADTYVYCFDKDDMVPIAKGHTQKKRLTKSDSNDTKPAVTNKTTKTKKGKNDEEKITKSPPDYTPADGIGFKTRRPYLHENLPAPRDLAMALEDRDDTRREIIRNLVVHWVNYKKQYRIDVLEGKQVYIFGHCLLPLGASQLPFTNNLLDEDSKPIDLKTLKNNELNDNKIKLLVKTTPIKLARLNEVTWTLEWMNQMRDTLGESDYCMFHIYRTICQTYGKIVPAEIVSNDTDVMWYSVINMNKYRDANPPILWKYEPHPRWVFFSGSPVHGKSQSVNIARLHHDIENANWTNAPPKPKGKAKTKKDKDIDDNMPLVQSGEHGDESENESDDEEGGKDKKAKRPKRDFWEDYERNEHKQKENFRKLNNRVLTFVAAMISAGGDYTIGLPNITHEVILHTLRRHSGYIGDLVTYVDFKKGVIKMDGTAFARFVKSAYMVAKVVRQGPVKKAIKIGDAPPELADPSTMHPQELQNKYEHLAPQNRLPPVYVQMIHGKQLLYFMKLAVQIGENSLREYKCLYYGYELIDDKKPLSRDNVKLTVIHPKEYKFE